MSHSMYFIVGMVTSAQKFLKTLFLILILTITSFALYDALYPSSVSAVCWCENGYLDGCQCGMTGTSAYSTDFGGVTVYCETEFEANSFWATRSPVCGSAAEVSPYCAPDVAGSNFFFCWGTNFVYGNLGDLQPGDHQYNFPDGSFCFNGACFGSGLEPVEVYACGSNTSCCNNPGGCDLSGAPGDTGGCSPQHFDEFGELLPMNPACDGGATGGHGTSGVGESRLWFSQARLVSALSAMAQSMFNPFKFNAVHNDGAFSKNAPPSDYSGRFDNLGALTTRIERHQGFDDSTPTVGSEFNNSSVIVGSQVPAPLSPHYDLFQSQTCYIPETFTNPGDDLIGAKIRAEMTMTIPFDLEVKGRPGGCFDDGEIIEDLPYPLPSNFYDPDCHLSSDVCANLVCCSATASEMPYDNECVRPVEPEGGGYPSCDDPAFPNACPPDDSGFAIPQWCCADPCVQETVDISCGTLPLIELAAGGEANPFSKTPLIENIYKIVLDDNDSLFRRFMPDIPGLFDFEHLPTKSSFGFNASVQNFGSVVPGSFRQEYAGGQSPGPEIYFPHLGTLYETWLNKFQLALNPFGFFNLGLGSDITDPLPGGSRCNEFNCGLFLGYNTFSEGLDCAARTLSSDKSRGFAQMIEKYGPWCDNETFGTSANNRPLPFGYNLFANFYDLYADVNRSCSLAPPSRDAILAAHDPSSPTYNPELDGDWDIICPNIDNDPDGIRKPGHPSYDYYRGPLESCTLSLSQLGWQNRDISNLYDQICGVSAANIVYPIFGQLNTSYNCGGGTSSRVYQVLDAAREQNVNPWLLLGIWATESAWGQSNPACMSQ